nr:retrovirus-related Pol polyprotein from transposon TNT 1-94 [Tanacetum cinerariifolium]
MSNTSTNIQTQTSNTLHNAIMEASSKHCPPMLAPGNYVQWKSRIKRYIDTKPNGKAYHREKMLLCKQEEAGIQLNVEQANWRDDTDDDELEDQELEAHYIEEIDQNDDDNDLAEESELLASLIEKLKCEIDESKNRNKFFETSSKVLIEKLQGEIEDFKNKSLESSKNFFKEANNRLSETNNLLYADYKKSKAELARRNGKEYASQMELECAKKEAQIKLYRTQEDKELEKVIEVENKVKVLDNIVYKTGQSVQMMNMLNNKYRTSFTKPEFLKKVQRANPRMYDIDEVTNLQCDCLELLEKCKGLKTELSKSKMMSKTFELVQKHAINLELELQQCKEKNKNDKLFKVNKTKDFCNEHEQYFEIQDLKAQLQDKGIVIIELKKLIKKLKVKSVDTKFEKLSVIQQPNAFKSQRPSVLGKLTTFSNSFVRKDFSKSTPQLKSNPQGDRVLRNSSQGKKQEGEDQHRSVKLSKNKTSVTACNDSLNAKTLNVNSVCATCDKCVLHDKHDMCVLNSVAKPIKKTVASESNKKPRNFTRKLYEHVSKTCSCWYSMFTPSGYKWKPMSRKEHVNLNLVEIVLFIVDSGCSKHMMGNLKLLINFLEKFLGTVKFWNDQIAPILGYGDLVQGAVMIKRVYYVEGLNHNLFSVSQFYDADFKVPPRKSTCYIHDFKGNDLLTGSHRMDLYSITLQDTNCPNPICLMAKASSSQAWLWHRHLSHLNFNTINLMSKNDIVVGLPNLKFVKDHLCSSCELGKAKRKSFHAKLTPSSKRRLQLLHMDLCGPMQVVSINGKIYALVIVDDYSRYTWTHFLRFKDETPEVLIDFLRLVQRGVLSQVRVVRTDKGMKFLNQPLHAYFAVEGILYQTSLARTPEQNGVVERRNLIPHHEKIPYHIINDRKPSVKFFYIFGSLCYIVRDGENLDKMKEKGDECIFVGYSTQSRAYRVFNKRTRVIMESIHVNFDELPHMASDQLSSDPAPECQSMALEHNSLSSTVQRQVNVPQADRTVTTSNELDLLFSLMFDELLNGSSKVVSKSSAVSAADPLNQHQHHTTPLNNHTTPLVEIVLFIVDSGCSKHMTGNLKLLINFVEKFLGTVKFRNDQIAPILGYGDLVQGAVTIKRVYYVEGLNHNLFFVGQFCDADLEVAFRESMCFICDLKRNDLLTGSRSTDLYSITLQDTNCPNPICLMAKATSSQAWLWHRHLSHLNFDTINLLSKNDIVVGLQTLKFVKYHLCSSCELGKAKRKSFHTKLTPSSKRRLQLLHMDLCGPMRVASINGKRYVLACQRGLQAQVRVVRTDKDTEFLNHTLHAYFAAEGILHQTSVARTPEQNGVVERWNRTLVEAARTMLSTAKVPLFFWAEAIATARFTQNQPTVSSSENIIQAETYVENDQVADDEFINIFCTLVQDQGETSSRHVDSSNMYTFYQRYPSEHRWTKDHPLEQVIGNPSQSVRTRRQLESDAEMCMFALT